MAIALGALFVAWSGCASGDTTTNSTSSGGGSTVGNGGNTNTGGKNTAGSGGGTGGGMVTCAVDEKTCNGSCVKVNDPAYGCTQTGCDACATPTNGTSLCALGICTLGDCVDGFKNCDGNDTNGCETDVKTDPNQCGGCGSTCMIPYATPNCVNGKCGIGTCSDGRVDCDGDLLNGCEADLQFDPKNCGSCGHPCPGTQTCEKGICGLYCPKDKANCDNDESNGCETPLHTLNDCEFCGDSCILNNASSTCDQNGVCSLGECDMGWMNCDNSSDTGCETNVAGDSNNCGNCGNVCPSGPNSTAVCKSGACDINCDPGYSNCDGNNLVGYATGCEVHSDVDVNNCGSGASACGNVCNLPNVQQNACVMGKCVIAQCKPGFMDCDNDPTNGCEVNTQNNAQNCGGCGMACTTNNGTPACVAGMCAVGTCNNGYADCNGIVSDGCEVNTNTDPSHCGGCNASNVCNIPNATPVCLGGTCAIGACNPGYQNCNNLMNDGCEVNTTNNPLNCGACFSQCFVANGTAGCSNSQCTVAGCNNGYGNCDGLSQNGCETDLMNSGTNCGTCGNNCQASCTGNVLATACQAGSCSILACTPGRFNVDGVCTNGCECATTGTSSACLSPSSLGALQVGQTTTFSGNLVPNGQEAYLSITFNGSSNTSYHPHITLTQGAAEFTFDILTNCQGAALSCGVEGGNSGNKTDWEVLYTGGDPNNSGFNPIPPVGSNGTVIIHVYRRPGKPVSCNNYTLTISN